MITAAVDVANLLCLQTDLIFFSPPYKTSLCSLRSLLIFSDKDKPVFKIIHVEQISHKVCLPACVLPVTAFW